MKRARLGTSREQIWGPRSSVAPEGFVERMPSGAWRGYRYFDGIGFGPFADRAEAVAWVLALVGWKREGGQ